MSRSSVLSVGAGLPRWIEPQFAKLAKVPPDGDRWAHEIKFDGYRMHARIECGAARLLTRTGVDWSERYSAVVRSLGALGVGDAYLDGELCAVKEDGTVSFDGMQVAHARGSKAQLIYYVFDLLHLDGADLREQPYLERKGRLQRLLKGVQQPLFYCDHLVGNGPAFFAAAAELGVEGVVSKRVDGLYRPGDRSRWVKCKCTSSEEFVVVGWAGSAEAVGALLVGYYIPCGDLVYAGRVGTGFTRIESGLLARLLGALEAPAMPLKRRPWGDRFTPRGALDGVRWVRPELVVCVSYLAWTAEGLLRHPSYKGVRSDKPAPEVARQSPVGAKRRWGRGGL